MTLDEAVDKAARELDAAFQARMDRDAFRMIEAGVPEDRVLDHVEDQREVYGPWRATTLAQIRVWLQAEITTS